MKIMIKKAVVLLLFCAAAVSFGACSAGGNEVSFDTTIPDQVGTTVSEESSDPAEETEPEGTEEETALTAFEPETSNNEEDWFTFEYYSGVMDSDNDNVVMAAEFLTSFIDCYFNIKETFAESDRIGNKYLKEYLDFIVKEDYEFRKNQSEHGSLNKACISLYNIAENDGIEYIEFRIGYYSNGGSTGDVGTVGIRDGKVVNFYSWYHLRNYDYLWNSDITQAMASHYIDISKYPNPWDDEELAKRMLNSYKMLYSGEYETFEAAWESLGEYNG